MAGSKGFNEEEKICSHLGEKAGDRGVAALPRISSGVSSVLRALLVVRIRGSTGLQVSNPRFCYCNIYWDMS
jgi:hypothetical protein